MSDDGTGGSAAQGSGNQNDAGNQQGQGQQDQGQQQTPPWGNDFDPQRAWQTIQHLRGRETELEGSLKDVQGRLKTFEDQGKSELEKASGRVTELETGISQRDNQIKLLQVQVEAGKRGIVDPEAAAAFMNWETYEKDPNQAFEDLKQRKAYLFASQQDPPVIGESQSGNPPRKNQNSNQEVTPGFGRIRAAIGSSN